jgi:hypothetical protein
MSPANLNNYISEIAQKLDVFGVDGIIDRAFELGLLSVVEKRETVPASTSKVEAGAMTLADIDVDQRPEDNSEVTD